MDAIAANKKAPRAAATASQNSPYPAPQQLSDIIDHGLRLSARYVSTHKPQQALDTLVPLSGHTEARESLRFQARLAGAYQAVIDQAVAANELGDFSMQPNEHGDWGQPILHATRLSCYLGVLGAASRFLALYHATTRLASTTRRPVPDDLQEAGPGMRRGIELALLGLCGLVDKTAYVAQQEALLLHNLVTDTEPAVNDGAEAVMGVTAPCRLGMYRGIAQATAPVTRHIRAMAQVDLDTFWRHWAVQEKAQYLTGEEVRGALGFLPHGQRFTPMPPGV